MYIYEQKNWPNFIWNDKTISPLLAETRHMQGLLTGRMESLGFTLKEDAVLQTLTQDVIKTSEIEGEKLDQEQVRSSIALKLGMDIASTFHKDRNIEGIVEIMLDATRKYDKPLTAERMFGWHSLLFPTGRSGLIRINSGGWRTKESGAMQIISGAYGREKVHYEAPEYNVIKKEMSKFIKWFESELAIDPVIKAAIAHFWFVTIHPFDDGNGRIARAIADMQLARSEKNYQRFYSMSLQIHRERKSYYDTLEQCQKGTLDITIWIEWFLNCLKRSIITSEETLGNVLIKANFWAKHSNNILNERQKIIINKLLEGFDGKLTSSKWAKITKCSQDTALRDIKELIERNILIKNADGGRSTGYSILI